MLSQFLKTYFFPLRFACSSAMSFLRILKSVSERTMFRSSRPPTEVILRSDLQPISPVQALMFLRQPENYTSVKPSISIVRRIMHMKAKLVSELSLKMILFPIKQMVI